MPTIVRGERVQVGFPAGKWLTRALSGRSAAEPPSPPLDTLVVSTALNRIRLDLAASVGHLFGVLIAAVQGAGSALIMPLGLAPLSAAFRAGVVALVNLTGRSRTALAGAMLSSNALEGSSASRWLATFPVVNRSASQ